MKLAPVFLGSLAKRRAATLFSFIAIVLGVALGMAVQAVHEAALGEFGRGLRTLSGEADLQVVVAFRMLPEVVWAMPRFGTFNVHAALLPQYRGAAPINWAVINGETQTGVTTFFLDHDIDTGRIIMQEPFAIPDDADVEYVYDGLMHLGAEIAVETIDKLIAAGLPSTRYGEYTRRFFVDSIRLLEVDNTFPRFIANEIPCSIRKVQYELDLDMIHGYEVDIDYAIKKLGIV